jgi:hypothetical protein
MTVYLSASWCGTTRAHERTGIVTNQPGALDLTRPHCAVAVCGQPSCIRKAEAHVAKLTGEPTFHITDSERVSL